jgi:hypothetical protein
MLFTYYHATRYPLMATKQPYLQDTYTSTSDTVLQALALGQTKFEEIIAEHERPVRSYNNLTSLLNMFV